MAAAEIINILIQRITKQLMKLIHVINWQPLVPHGETNGQERVSFICQKVLYTVGCQCLLINQIN